MDDRPRHRPRMLITAGPTHEPIDAVRFIGNRSSGRMGVALADACDRLGWATTLLLGPTAVTPDRAGVAVRRFASTADLEGLLTEHLPACDVLVMAAAVCDYRPVIDDEAQLSGKLRRTPGTMRLTLESTPDLLAGCARRRRPGQLLVGFALEPKETMLDSARAKLARKGIDAIVANPLETMDAERIEAVLLAAEDGGAEAAVFAETGGAILKTEFGPWLAERLAELRERLAEPQDQSRSATRAVS